MKYLFKGKVVEVGDVVGMTTSSGEMVMQLNLTTELVEILKKHGFIEEYKEDKKEGTHLDISYYIDHLAKRIRWDYINVVKYLDRLSHINYTAVLYVLIKEIAVVLDRKYKNHIKESESIFTISLIDGNIHEVDKKIIKSYNNLAAFRSQEDALVAKYILKHLLSDSSDGK